jgi:gliding motility-associated-like protein
MRRLFLLICLLTAFCSSGQVIPNYVPTDSLVGWWPFSGNANDISGNGLNGTVYNSPSLVSDRFGNANSAYSFNWTGASYGGNWQKIELPTTVTTGEFTINAWIKPSDYCWPNNSIKSAMIIGGSAQCTNTYGDLRFALSGNDGSLGFRHNGVNGISDTGLIQLSVWQMATLVVKNDSVTMYVDGNKAQSFSHNFSPGFNTCLSVGLHHQGNGHWYYFNGAIDDLGIWNKALSECEIQNLYNSNLGSCMVGEVSDTTICLGDTLSLSTRVLANCNNLPTNLLTDLEGWYPFCGNANDESGNGKHGTVYGATLTSDRFGNSDKAYLFNQNNAAHRIELPIDTVNNGIVSDFTAAIWVKPTRQVNNVSNSTACPGTVTVPMAFSNQNWAIIPGNFGTDMGVGLSIGTNGAFVSTHANNILVSRSQNTFNKTGFVFVTIVHSQNTVKLYVDGILVQTISNYCTSNLKKLAGNLRLGDDLYSPGFSGVIDDFGVWSKALTSSEVSQLYNLTSPNTTSSQLWSTGDTTSTINVSPSTTTKYWVRQIAGTDTIVDTITVNVLNPTINASTNSICNPGDSVMLWTSKDSSVTQSCGGMPASLQNGLMAYYPFCGNANDLSGFGNHGTVLNAALANDRNGNPQSAYYFDGSSKITVPSSAQISDSLNTQVTFSTWINVESYPNSFGPILSKNGPITRQFEVWVGPNKLGFWSTQIYGSATTTVPYNTWLHYVVTFDQGTVKYYLNSTLIQTSSYTTTSLAGNNSVFEIGHDSPGVLELFKGYIDDVAIWNRVLSPADVANLYNHSTNYSNTLWSTGETTDTIWINPNSDTTIWVSSTLGNVTCVDSINIDFLSPEIHSNTLGVCAPGDTAILWVENESHSVTWSTGETSDTIFVTPVAATSYWVQFTSFNGVCSDTVEIDVSEPIEIFGDSLLCKGDSVLLYVDGSSFFSLSDTLYFNNFENTIGNEFSTTATTTFSGSSLLGNFGNQTITLSLSSLPLDSIRFSFDLWIHDSWDGNSTGVNGTDSLSIHWNQFSLLHTTFNNHTGGTQSYPNNYPASNPSKTGSILSTSSLCSGQGSSKYHLSFDTNNNSANGVFSFDGTPSQSLCDESWSIDNVLIEALNGVATSSVMWSTGESSDSIWVKPTQTTTYWVSSTDQYGCESTDSITVLVSDIQSTISVEEPSCNGSSDGQAQINPTGGITPYTFLWGNGSGSSMANNLSSDTVWVAVTDSIGCSAVDTFYIDQPDSLIISNIQTSNYNGFNVSCNGGSDGSVSTTVIGGTMPYYYNWNNNTYTTSSISNVGAGTYVLQVTDTNGCAVNETIVLAEPNPIIISPSITSNYNGYAISCYGESDGSADVTIAGGIAPYSILWSNGVPTSSITNVSSGSYSVIITDDNGCVDSAQINLNQPNPLTGTAVVTDASCYGNADGSLDLTLSGGAGSYFIAWSTGDSSLSVYNLPSGWYTYSVISSNNCEIADSVYINQPTPLTIELDTVHPTCINSFDGELNVVAMGGTPGYNYFLNGNAFTGSIQGLGTDSLRILAVDFNNCDTLFVIAMPPVRDPCIFIPNWFSPNGNSKEDLWLIEGFEYGQLKLRIFNVYGQQIYYTESQNYVPWDGTYNGKELPNGDYYYVIESENYFSQYTGYVTILR